MSKTMEKYEPLGEYLRKQVLEHIPMTFDDIERILGLQLPASKKYQAWWSNSTSNNLLTHQWLDAGYQTESVDVASKKLIFRRVSHSKNFTTRSTEIGNVADTLLQKKSRRNPVFGCMKGTVTIPEGVDMTEPADPDWAQSIEEKYPR